MDVQVLKHFGSHILAGIEASNFSTVNKVPRQSDFLSCSHLMFEADAGLSCLVSLMELYCGGNNVEAGREVGHLRGLLKLIILDLTGNPVAAHDDYRLYTIYHLRKLKVMMHGMQSKQCACQLDEQSCLLQHLGGLTLTVCFKCQCCSLSRQSVPKLGSRRHYLGPGECT